MFNFWGTSPSGVKLPDRWEMERSMDRSKQLNEQRELELSAGYQLKKLNEKIDKIFDLLKNK